MMRISQRGTADGRRRPQQLQRQLQRQRQKRWTRIHADFERRNGTDTTTATARTFGTATAKLYETTQLAHAAAFPRGVFTKAFAVAVAVAVSVPFCRSDPRKSASNAVDAAVAVAALAQPHLRSCLEIGSDRILLPVAAKMALHRAGGAGGSAGSPIPVGGKSVFLQCTSITGGASRMRNNG
jgi:hypothetical protein